MRTPRCPSCGSSSVAEYVYGMPDFIYYSELESKGFKFIYGGCTIDGTEQDYHCEECNTDFVRHKSKLPLHD